MKPERVCGNCYWFSKFPVPCCDLEKDPTKETAKACDRWEEREEE